MFFIFFKNVWLIDVEGRLSYSCVPNFSECNSRRAWWNVLKSIKMRLGGGGGQGEEEWLGQTLIKDKSKKMQLVVFLSKPLPCIRHTTARVLRKTKISRLPKCNCDDDIAVEHLWRHHFVVICLMLKPISCTKNKK